ncbi:MAG: F0F1 ATP synthase subunit delta [Candidatus Komeilibacteria bacterium]|nr:F0F1 ATP synthase subunit delta [Candidatus Komeilibacteria bacterium]
MATKFIQRLAEAAYRASINKQKREIDAIAERALSLLKTKRMLGKTGDFFTQLALVRRREEGIVEAVVESRYPLSSGELKAIKDFLKRTTRRDVILTAVERRDLLGGFRVRYDDVVFDATVDAQLKQLAQHVTS